MSKKKTRKAASHAKLLAELKAAEREIKTGEKIMRATKSTLRAAGKVVNSVQRVDALAAKVIVHGVKGQSRAKRIAAKRGWDK